MRFQELFLDAGAVPPLFLHAPGEAIKAERVDGLSLAGTRELRASESTQLLRSLVDDEARRHGARVTLDVFTQVTTQSSIASLHGTRSQPRRAWMPSLNPAGHCRGARRVGIGIGSSRSFFHGGPYFRPRSRNSARTGYGLLSSCHMSVLSDPAWHTLMGASLTRVDTFSQPRLFSGT